MWDCVMFHVEPGRLVLRIGVSGSTLIQDAYKLCASIAETIVHGPLGLWVYMLWEINPSYSIDVRTIIHVHNYANGTRILLEGKRQPSCYPGNAHFSCVHFKLSRTRTRVRTCGKEPCQIELLISNWQVMHARKTSRSTRSTSTFPLACTVFARWTVKNLRPCMTIQDCAQVKMIFSLRFESPSKVGD